MSAGAADKGNTGEAFRGRDGRRLAPIALCNRNAAVAAVVTVSQDCESKVRDIGERLKALDKDMVGLNRRDNELLAEKKTLCELKGKKRQLEQKISTKQDR